MSKRADAWRYNFLTNKWKAKYLPATQPEPYDPTKVKAQKRVGCQKCGSFWKVSRHHKGHEYVFAQINENWYAKRYIEFHEEDVVPLCERCHLKIHRLYKPIMDEMNLWLKECEPTRDPDSQDLKFKFVPGLASLESYRKRLISKCDRWLQNKIKPRRRGRSTQRASKQGNPLRGKRKD